MTTRIVFVRAINVGPATLPMAELRTIAADLGAREPRTYIASGNLIADVPEPSAEFDRALEAAIEARFGFYREVMSRTPEQLRAALAAHPFRVIEAKYSYVSFLAAEPSSQALAEAERIATGEDQWQVIGTEMHLRYASGAGRPSMKTDTIMRALGTVGTARNLNTVRTLIERTEPA